MTIDQADHMCRQPAEAKTGGGRRPAGALRGIVVLHLAPRSVRSRVSAEHGSGISPGLPLISRTSSSAALAFLGYGYWLVYRSAHACADGEACARPLPNRLVKTGPYPRDHSRRCRARPGLHRTAVPRLMTGDFPMNKLLALGAFAIGIITSPAVMAADKNDHLGREQYGLRCLPLYRQRQPASRSRRCQGGGFLQG